jgi:glutamyl-tRNA synthetase
MRNFLALLGWSPGDDREILSQDELVRLFTLEGIQTKAAVFDLAKLEWMNGEYISALPAEALLPGVAGELERMGVDARGRDLVPVIEAVKSRARTVLQAAERVAVRLDPSRAQLDAKGEALIRKLGGAFAVNLGRAADALERLPEDAWAPERILSALTQEAEAHSLKLGDIMQPVRVAITGSTVSEPVNELLAVVDRPTALARMREVADRSREDPPRVAHA